MFATWISNIYDLSSNEEKRLFKIMARSLLSVSRHERRYIFLNGMGQEACRQAAWRRPSLSTRRRNGGRRSLLLVRYVHQYGHYDNHLGENQWIFCYLHDPKALHSVKKNHRGQISEIARNNNLQMQFVSFKFSFFKLFGQNIADHQILNFESRNSDLVFFLHYLFLRNKLSLAFWSSYLCK